MDIRILRYFVAIVDSGSLTKAAERVLVAQPALSHHLATLESELGVQLLLRTSKGIKPTDAGMTLYRHARSIMKQLETATHEVRNAASTVSGTVAIGLPTTVAAVLAMPLLKAVRTTYPAVKLQLFESMSGYITELLANARLDFAVLFRVADTRSVELEPLAEEALCLMGQRDLAPTFARDQDTIELHEIGSLPLVLPSGGQGLRSLVERSFAEVRITPNIVAELDSLPCLLGAAEQGIAFTILPTATLAATGKEISTWQITPAIRRTLSLCWPQAVPRTPAALAVEGLLRTLTTARTDSSGALR